jgi:hypothetical protein
MRLTCLASERLEFKAQYCKATKTKNQTDQKTSKIYSLIHDMETF